MPPLPTTFGVDRHDQRSHIEARDPVIVEKGPPMTPEQFAELTTLLRVMLQPVNELATRQLALMDAYPPIPAAPPTEPPPISPVEDPSIAPPASAEAPGDAALAVAAGDVVVTAPVEPAT